MEPSHQYPAAHRSSPEASLDPQVVLHVVASAHPRCWAQGFSVVPLAHAPIPSQCSLVSLSFMHALAAPHGVFASGRTHAPMPSQSVAPHGPPAIGHSAVQQCPTPVVPQTPLRHSPWDAHGAPSGSTQNVLPGVGQTAVGAAQSAFVAHVVLHAAAFAHARPPAQGLGSPAPQRPDWHTSAVSIPASQDVAPQAVFAG